MKIAFSPSIQKLIDDEQCVVLGDLSNVASGVGADVLELVRIGLWEAKERHVGSNQDGWTRYGPKAARLSRTGGEQQ